MNRPKRNPGFALENPTEAQLLHEREQRIIRETIRILQDKPLKYRGVDMTPCLPIIDPRDMVNPLFAVGMKRKK